MILNDRSTSIVNYVNLFIGEHQYSPSLIDISEGTDIPLASVARNVDSLKAKGILYSDTTHKARTLRVTEEYKSTVTKFEVF